MYRHWHDEQNDYTKIVLKTAMAKGDINRVGPAAEAIPVKELAPV
jgi:hypothetical protein